LRSSTTGAGGHVRLPANPATATTKRREPRDGARLLRAEEVSSWRAPRRQARTAAAAARLEADEIEWRAREDAQDGELFRIAAFTGLRLGELLAALGRRRPRPAPLVVQRAVSAGVEGRPRAGRRAFSTSRPGGRSFPAAARARGLHAAQRLRLLLAPRPAPGRSAVRRRFKRAQLAAGLRPLRFHALRHAAAALSHARRPTSCRRSSAFAITTTERYMHAKARRKTWTSSTGISGDQAGGANAAQ